MNKYEIVSDFESLIKKTLDVEQLIALKRRIDFNIDRGDFIKTKGDEDEDEKKENNN